MDDDADARKARSGWGELGPKWITAVATLITALAGTGFILGRSTAPDRGDPGRGPDDTATVTVTENAPDEQVGGETSTPTDPAVHWAGELTFDSNAKGYNLDVLPPTHTAGRYVEIFIDALESHGDAATFTVWKSAGVPGKDDCAAAVADEGVSRINPVVENNHICGRTYEGRIFRMTIVATSGETQVDVVVWK
ncbi:hypothetical protein ACQPZU_20900 [Saccharomonospora azurea]|uniref:hypothetical protein n=1 Tax=Saccharomonospora azurea TaxID=40988 RepID=UPI003D8E6C15